MSKNKRLYACFVLGLSFLVSACMDASIPSEEVEETAPATEASSPTPPPSDLAPGEVPNETDPSENTLALNGDGFLLITAAEETERVEFGESIESATDAVSVVFGQPAITAAPNAECPAGPMEFTSWGNGFTLNAVNGELVGWSVRSHNAAGTPLFTDKGIGVGTSRETLAAAYSTTIEQTTLGTEFYTDSALSGILSSDTPDATIEYLWAGTPCNFR